MRVRRPHARLALSLLLPTLAALAAVSLPGCLPPEWGANAILHPQRRSLSAVAAPPHREVRFQGEGAEIHGWLFPASAPRRGLIVYLHGLGDNRLHGVGIAQRFGPRGYDVLAYDSRAHGESTGAACTYGFYEKRDLSRALDAVGADSAILFGSSMGAAVAVQAAAVEPRVRGVIAQSPFADLREIIHQMAPFFASHGQVEAAIARAELRAAFRVSAVSPAESARHIRVPVLIVHGDSDSVIPPAHARRIYDALPGRRELVIVPGAGHNDVLRRDEAWTAIERWLLALPAS